MSTKCLPDETKLFLPPTWGILGTIVMNSESVAAHQWKRARTVPHLRWYICGLLFFGVVINYIDRQAFSIMAPDLQRIIGWSELDYGRIVIAFQVAYAVMMLFAGRILDRIGTRLGLGLALVWWSVAEMCHALARTPLQFGVARFFLGIGEAASYPASVKTVGEWFPARERALATGIFNGAATIGAIGAPILVPLFAAAYGWEGAFVGTGALGLVWLAAWWGFYHKPQDHPRLSEAELLLIRQGQTVPATEKVSWIGLLGRRQLWAHAAPRILTEWVYWFFLYWLPKFLAQRYGIRGTAMIPYLTTIYVLTGFGSVAGGYISSTLIRRGWSVNWARKAAMGISAIVMPFVIFASKTHSPWTAAILIGVALAAHQGWFTNISTLVLDMFPARAVGSVYGIGGCLAGIGSVLAAEKTGEILQRDPNFYFPMFVVSGCIYLAALIIVHLLVPKLEPAKM